MDPRDEDLIDELDADHPDKRVDGAVMDQREEELMASLEAEEVGGCHHRAMLIHFSVGDLSSVESGESTGAPRQGRVAVSGRAC